MRYVSRRRIRKIFTFESAYELDPESAKKVGGGCSMTSAGRSELR